MPRKQVRVLYHDHCFDGSASAAFFSQFYQDHVDRDAEFRYTGMAHTANQCFEDRLFDGDENAIVDFKYSPHPNLTWWFDHHQSAFLSPADAEHFRTQRNGNYFFDPAFKSCTLFIATVAREKFGYHNPSLDNLVKWADIIDGAQYNSAEEAVALGAAAMKLTLVIESSNGSDVVQRIIGHMRSKPLDEIIALPEIDALFRPLHQRHLSNIDVIRKRSNADGRVVYFDLVEDGIEGYNKFIPYYLFPENIYTVSVSTSSFRTKVSVGSSPWQASRVTHNLASICERYGGGGHPKVGAISFPIGDVDNARRAAREIVQELQSA
ncbi:MAG: phosphoesterase [Acidobacteria bacterium]|nr:phosphoesterase [Acidobacteriota bacterium]